MDGCGHARGSGPPRTRATTWSAGRGAGRAARGPGRLGSLTKLTHLEAYARPGKFPQAVTFLTALRTLCVTFVADQSIGGGVEEAAATVRLPEVVTACSALTSLKLGVSRYGWGDEVEVLDPYLAGLEHVAQGIPALRVLDIGEECFLGESQLELRGSFDELLVVDLDGMWDESD